MAQIITLDVPTSERTEMIDVTGRVVQAVTQSGVTEGVCRVYVPHTTAGVTINENADPDVCSDMVMELNRLVPFNDGYRHAEGNSAAHIKSTLTGFSQTVFISSGSLVLGTWQGIYFCEFDGPRRRKLLVRISDG